MPRGIIQTQLLQSVAGRFLVRPTHAVQGPYVRATLYRALRRTPCVFTGSDHVYAARRLQRETSLPDRGPWALTLPELRTLVIALRWRRASCSACDPRHDAIAQEIFRTYRDAISTPQT